MPEASRFRLLEYALLSLRDRCFTLNTGEVPQINVRVVMGRKILTRRKPVLCYVIPNEISD